MVLLITMVTYPFLSFFCILIFQFNFSNLLFEVAFFWILTSLSILDSQFMISHDVGKKKIARLD